MTTAILANPEAARVDVPSRRIYLHDTAHGLIACATCQLCGDRLGVGRAITFALPAADDDPGELYCRACWRQAYHSDPDGGL